MAKFKGEIKNCEECGIEFKIPMCRKNTAKYCSKKCADLHRVDGRRIDRVHKNCIRCGKQFYEHRCHAERRKFCSYKCANMDYESRSGGRGDGHFYNRTLWRKLRKETLLRDKNICQKCGYSALRYMQVHHILFRRNGGHDGVDNLITLCNSCHRLVHWESENKARAC